MAARKIPTYPDKIKGSFKGTIEAPEGVLKITKIAGHYDLTIPKGTREKAERALHVFDRNCPVSQTLKGSVKIEHSWSITEEE
ncbi:hypothetical protein ERJ70_03350 [Sediminibacillus dalangtanensis]|uniref:OsmC-like protein n=1 Tax=Sediminibacillus dalangtanensis TaxID=2729421 RepID=A0ABX7VXS4_9BACI|nr:hypothetical protein ERJ70_03350 [Sediminibacillus dalangtanensis]